MTCSPHSFLVIDKNIRVRGKQPRLFFHSMIRTDLYKVRYHVVREEMI
jgi:hypothetical protein